LILGVGSGFKITDFSNSYNNSGWGILKNKEEDLAADISQVLWALDAYGLMDSTALGVAPNIW
jgi:hypothetical protein